VSEMSPWVRIDYTNWRGERAERLVQPYRIEFGSNEWHPEEQWLLYAHDDKSDSGRTFALANIHSWKPEGKW
jgi:predicted DNA-binding transcriptional regulator YafY